MSLTAGTLVYVDISRASDGSERMGVWRLGLGGRASSPILLDEFPNVIRGGGDTISPVPAPKTNGRDVVWLRTRPSSATADLMLASAPGVPRMIRSNLFLPFHAIDEQGRVAFVVTTEKENALLLYEPVAGRAREIAKRSAEESGLPAWVNGKIAWFDSYFNVRFASRAELFDPSTGASTTFAPPTGCGLAGQTTRRHVLVTCFGGLTAVHDVISGKALPLAPLVFASRDALLMRSTAEFNAGEDAWLHAAVLPP